MVKYLSELFVKMSTLNMSKYVRDHPEFILSNCTQIKAIKETTYTYYRQVTDSYLAVAGQQSS